MTESVKSKRPTKPARRISKPPRDARVDSAPPAREETVVRRAAADVIPARIASLQAEVTRLTAERAAEADDMAAMLVRVAEAERAKITTATRVTQLEASVQAVENELVATRTDAVEVQRRHDEMRKGREAAELELRGVKDVAAAALERATRAEERLARAEAAHGDAIEALTARLTHEHTAEVDALLKGHAAAVETARAERMAALEALRKEHAATSDANVTKHAAATEALRKEHAATVEAAERRRAADVQAVEQRLSKEAASLAASHAAALESQKHGHAEALGALEKLHASALASLREEHATARRTASYALEEERSAAARVRQQLTTAEAQVVALRTATGRATEVLTELQQHEMEATLARGRSVAEAIAALEEEPPSASLATPREAAPPRDASKAPRSPQSIAATASLDEIDIELPE